MGTSLISQEPWVRRDEWRGFVARFPRLAELWRESRGGRGAALPDAWGGVPDPDWTFARVAPDHPARLAGARRIARVRGFRSEFPADEDRARADAVALARAEADLAEMRALSREPDRAALSRAETDWARKSSTFERFLRLSPDTTPR